MIVPIRNLTELKIHNDRTDEVLGADTAAAARARERHTLALVEWLGTSASDRAVFNAFFGPEP